MKLITSQSIKDIERATCEEQNITSDELMERAASAVVNELMSKFLPSKRFVIIAGPGNNGGDALAVARLLNEQRCKRVEVFLFNVKGRLSQGCKSQRDKLLAMDNIDFTEVTRQFDPPMLSKDDVVIDGLFGCGLNMSLQGGFQSLARLVNESGAYVVSIDIPSGLFGEWNDDVIQRDIIHADMTLTFQFPRVSFFFEENSDIIGKWEVCDIRLSEEKIRATPTNYFLLEAKNIRNVLKARR